MILKSVLIFIYIVATCFRQDRCYTQAKSDNKPSNDWYHRIFTFASSKTLDRWTHRTSIRLIAWNLQNVSNQRGGVCSLYLASMSKKTTASKSLPTSAVYAPVKCIVCVCVCVCVFMRVRVQEIEEREREREKTRMYVCASSIQVLTGRWILRKVGRQIQWHSTEDQVPLQ